MALGALRALARLGVRVPDDLSLVAFGNPDFVRYATPAITTVDLPVAMAGQVAVELALRRMQRPEEKEVRMLDTSLLVRETTGPSEEDASLSGNGVTSQGVGVAGWQGDDSRCPLCLARSSSRSSASTQTSRLLDFSTSRLNEKEHDMGRRCRSISVTG